MMIGDKVSMVTVKLLDGTDHVYTLKDLETTCICITDDEIRIKEGKRFITFVKRNLQGYYYQI